MTTSTSSATGFALDVRRERVVAVAGEVLVGPQVADVGTTGDQPLVALGEVLGADRLRIEIRGRAVGFGHGSILGRVGRTDPGPRRGRVVSNRSSPQGPRVPARGWRRDLRTGTDPSTDGGRGRVRRRFLVGWSMGPYNGSPVVVGVRTRGWWRRFSWDRPTAQGTSVRGGLSPPRVVGEYRSVDRVAKLLWSLFAVLATLGAVEYYRRGLFSLDFDVVWAAAHALLHHRTHWKEFVYPPGCLVFALPLAVLPLRVARLVIYAAQFAGLAFTFWAVTRITRQSLGSRGVAAVACLLAVGGQMAYAVNYENVTILLVALAAGFFLAVDRGRWTAAAVLLGISLTVKPLLVPLVVVLLLARRWRETALVVGIPLVLSAAVLLYSGAASEFVHELTGSFGWNATAPVNVSITAAGRFLSLPEWLVTFVRGGTLVAGLGICHRFWRRPVASPGEQAVWLTAPLTVVLILCFTFAWAYYAMLLIPLVLVTLADEGDLGRRLVQGGVVVSLLFPVLAVATPGYPGVHVSDLLCAVGLFAVLLGTGLAHVHAGVRPVGSDAAVGDRRPGGQARSAGPRGTAATPRSALDAPAPADP